MAVFRLDYYGSFLWGLLERKIMFAITERLLDAVSRHVMLLIWTTPRFLIPSFISTTINRLINISTLFDSFGVIFMTSTKALEAPKSGMATLSPLEQLNKDACWTDIS
jgi:hypothetical protein